MGKKSHSLNGDEKLDVHIIKSKWAFAPTLHYIEKLPQKGS